MRKRRIVLLAASATAAVALPSAASADIVHVVRPGESLTSIAALDGLSEAALAAANGLSANAGLQVGTVIEIPPRYSGDTAGSSSSSATSATATQPAVESATGSYVVKPGDTLSGIAAAAGESVRELATANNLNPGSLLLAGTALTVPGDGAPGATGSAVSDGSSSGSYVVQPGDTLSEIAASLGCTVMELAVTNDMSPNAVLLSGTTLTLPTGSADDTSATTENVSGSANQQAPGTDAGPYPTDQYVDGPEVAAIAQEYGVDAAFAEAIGWQESGFDNGVTSPTGAVGVMQIEPDTWNWLQANVAGDSLEPASASDNVRGGVLLLKDLIDQTGSESEAAAAYYQGLGSVQQNGMYSTTRRYVADVMALTARFGS